jgi:hypothetical protein
MLPTLLAADGVFTLSDRTEARLRAPDTASYAAGVDLDTAVDARAVWTKRSMTYTLSDSPRFTLVDFTNGTQTQAAFSDGLTAAAEWHSLRARIRLSETGTYGQLTLASNPVLQTPPAQTSTPEMQGLPPSTVTLVPQTPRSLSFASSDTSVTTALQVRPWTLTARVGYVVSGGADSASQQVLPFGQGPVAQGGADLRLSARDRDHLVTVANASEASFSSGTEDVVVGAEEQWRHKWTRRSESMLGVGWNAVRSRSAPNAPNVYGSSPGAEAGFMEHFVHGRDSGDLRFDLRLSPIINPLTGLVDDQLRATIEGRWMHGPRVTYRAVASAGGSADQGTTTSVRQALAEADVGYIASKWITWEGGVRGLYQEQNAPGAAVAGGSTPIVEGSFGQVVFFFAVTWRAVKVRF